MIEIGTGSMSILQNRVKCRNKQVKLVPLHYAAQLRHIRSGITSSCVADMFSSGMRILVQCPCWTLQVCFSRFIPSQENPRAKALPASSVVGNYPKLLLWIFASTVAFSTEVDHCGNVFPVFKKSCMWGRYIGDMLVTLCRDKVESNINNECFPPVECPLLNILSH